MKFRASLLLLCSTILICGCENNGGHTANIHRKDDNADYVTVHFETCTEEETNVINDQHLLPGSLVEEPALLCIKNQSIKKRVEGWYLENNYLNKWDFLSDYASSDMTLYARWMDVINVNYYLQNNSEPIYSAKSVFVGQTLPLHDELCDGYEFFGYYSNPACTTPFDLNTPLYTDQNVYLKCGDKFYFNAKTIKRRFSMMAASGSGSKVGNISDVQTDGSGQEYVDINFGYSKAADPHMNLTGLEIDISKSQKLRFKYKNFGHAKRIGFYWVSKYEDGSYSGGVNGYSETNCYRETFSSSEYNMSENDPWLVKEFDLSQIIIDGKSSWGKSKTLIRLRIQFEYTSTSIDDLSNVVRIATIEGVPDSTHIDTDDSPEVKALLSNDSDYALEQASNNQTQNVGVIFPKNNNLISSMSTTYYKKVDGLVMYGIYGSTSNRFVFDVSGQNIIGNQYNNLTFRLRNYSYISNLTINITVKDTSTGKTSNNKKTLTISTRMNQFNNFNLSLSGLSNMNGVVQTIRITFDANGVDNAILLESATFKL